MDRAVSTGLSAEARRAIENNALLELFQENRFNSLERYVAFLVTFHAMAKFPSSFWFVGWDTSRSQSQLRIATTAAPVSAAEVEAEWRV